MNEIVAAVDKFGLPIALLIYFVWMQYKYTNKLEQKLDAIEAYQKEQLVSVVLATQRYIGDQTYILSQLFAILRKRPCIAKDVDDLELRDKNEYDLDKSKSA